MYNLQVNFIIFLYGFNHVHGFFHFRHHDFLFDQSATFNKSSLRSDPTLWFEQPVDHFNQSDQRTWKMKYYKVMDSWKPGGPIFLYINGEAALSLRTLQHTKLLNDAEHQSIIGQLIQETGAAYYMLEHRYYGDSRPFDDQTTENMAFLTARQALADIAHLLQTIKASEEFSNSKVLVIGGSYAGNLAAWMKVMYPNLVDAVLSSSAPVLAKKDFYEYLETVTETFTTYGSQDCVNKIRNLFNVFHILLQSSEGIERLKEEQNICEDVDMTVPENQQLFFLLATHPYTNASQYGTPRCISSLCQNFELGQYNQKLRYLFPFLYNELDDCKDLNFNKTVQYIMHKKPDSRSWLYQTCTEFGYFQSTSSSKQMFGDSIPVDFYYKMCSLVFGEEFNEQRVEQGVTNTNNMYGGLTPNVENVVFVNGDMDPWHRLGILHDLTVNVPTIYIMGSSHCYDLSPDSVEDNESVMKARNRIKKLLKQWILGTA